MLKPARHSQTRPGLAAGFTLVEVLVTMVLLAVGLLGLAQLQSRVMISNDEAYQRSQAVEIANDMAARMHANSANAASYAGASVLGTGDSLSTCTGGPSATYDLCEWSSILKGATETAGTNKVGGMINARGCITQVQAPNTTAGSCAAGIYQVTVVWQGAVQTVAPTSSCGQNLYYNEALRRAISIRVLVPVNAC